RAAGVGHDSARKPGQTASRNIGYVPDGAIDHNSGYTLAKRSLGRESPPDRRVTLRAPVDHEDGALRALGQSLPDHEDVRGVDSHWERRPRHTGVSRTGAHLVIHRAGFA